MGADISNDMNSEKFDFDSVTTTKHFIDKGAFGDVFGPFTWNSKLCAIKRIWISQGRHGDDVKRKVVNKTDMWTSLKHRNLIEIQKVILRPKVLYIIMECVSGGSLRRLLDKSDGTYYRNITNWARQIAEGMLYLHGANIVHRDLKSNNILLSEPFGFAGARKEITLKITDFDEVREIDHTAALSFRGTYAYMAPEVLRREKISKSSDTWSYGVVVWEMLTAKRAHESLADGEIMQKAMSGELMLSIPESFSKAYKELLHGCLHKDKDSRLSFCNIIDQLLSIEDKGMYKEDPVLVQMIKTKVGEKENNAILGLTILDNELFVVSVESSEVEVYDSIKFSFSRLWNLKELTDPHDIGSCNRNKCLYIINEKREILRVDPNGKLIKKWSTGSNFGFGLFVTNESNVIFTVFNKNKLNEYSPDGQLIREINLSSDNDMTWEDGRILYTGHAVKLASGDFAYTYGIFWDVIRRMCVMGGDGKLKKSFSAKCADPMEQMFGVVHLAVDGSGFVMVVDLTNNLVLLLDSDLEFKGEMLSKKHGLRRPRRILMDQTNGRLFVADNDLKWGDAQVLIYEFR